ACRRLDAAEAEAGRGPEAERGEGDVAARGLAAQRRRAALLGEVVGVEPDVGEVDEGLEAERAGLEAVGDLAEGLGGAGGVVAGQAVREAGEGDPALGLDLVTGIAGAAAQAERAPLRAAVEAEVPVPAGAGGGAA